MADVIRSPSREKNPLRAYVDELVSRALVGDLEARRALAALVIVRG